MPSLFADKISFFDNNSLHFSKQDRPSTLLLALFLLLLPYFSRRFLLFLFLLPLFLFSLPSLLKEKKARLSDLFILCFFATLAAGFFKAEAARPTLAAMLYPIAFFVARAYRERSAFVSFCLVLAGGAVGALALWESLSGSAASLWSDASRFGILPRASLPFGNPNLLGAFLAPAMVLALSHLVNAASTRLRLFYLLSLLLIGGGLAATYSRGAWLGAVGGMAIYFLGGAKSQKGEWKARLAFPALGERLISIFSPDSSVGYRFSLWKSILRLPWERLIGGVGEGKAALYALASPYMAAGLERVEHTHSLYLHLLTAEGALGLLFFCLFLFSALKRASRDVRGGLVSLLIYGLFDDPFYSGRIGVLFWLLAGLA